MTGFTLKLVPDDEMRAVFVDIIHRLARIEGLMVTETEAVASLNAKLSELGEGLEQLFAAVDAMTSAVRNATDVSAEIVTAADTVEALRVAVANKLNPPAQPA